jgi:hypothetical protein
MDWVTLDGSSPLVMNPVATANYFVTGDPVSVIGTHIGNTYELKMPAPGFLNLGETVNRHMLSTVESLVIKDGLVDFGGAVEAAPPYSKPINALRGLGRVLSFLGDEHSDKLSLRLETLTLLERVAGIAVKRNLSHHTDHALLRYVAAIAGDFKKELEAEPMDDLRQTMIADLTHLIHAIETYQ